MKSPELSFSLKRHSLQIGSVLNMILYFDFDTVNAENACFSKYIPEDIMKEVTFLIALDNHMFSFREGSLDASGRPSCPLRSFLYAGVRLFIQQTCAERRCVLTPRLPH